MDILWHRFSDDLTTNKLKIMRAPVSFIFLLLLITIQLTAQVGTNELPAGLKYSIDISELKPYIFYPHSVTLEQPIDKEPLHTGYSVPVNIEFSQVASKIILHDSLNIWQLRVKVPGAVKLGVVFSELRITGKDKLFIYEPSGKNFAGAFTSNNNRYHGLLSARVIPGNELIIEYVSANLSAYPPSFLIDELIYIFHDEETMKSSGACNVNINCNEGFMWQKQKRGVARILLRSGNNWYNCSGSLVNNTLENGAPYFLTADHCGANASEEDLLVWQFYFNNEYDGCENSGSAPNNMTITGSIILAKAALQGGTDFKLLELEESVPDTWNPYYNGWSLSSRPATNGVTIHHPSGDAKKISTYTDETTTATFSGGLSGAFWRTVWTETESGYGVTEGGSSGSPLFDQDGLIIGTLTGGGASCTNPDLPDFYGKFYRHWQSNGTTPETSLQPWLDPENDDILHLYGYDPNRNTDFVKVDIVPALGGTIQGAGYYAEDEFVYLRAIPNEGFNFLNWTDTLGHILSTDIIYQFTMPDSQKRVFANFMESPTEISEVATDQVIRIYPNPAAEKVFIELGNIKNQVNIQFINATGQIVLHKRYSVINENKTAEFDINFLKPGIYFITVSNNHNTSTHKLIVNPKY
jgi:hypothetical protein